MLAVTFPAFECLATCGIDIPVTPAPPFVSNTSSSVTSTFLVATESPRQRSRYQINLQEAPFDIMLEGMHPFFLDVVTRMVLSDISQGVLPTRALLPSS